MTPEELIRQASNLCEQLVDEADELLSDSESRPIGEAGDSTRAAQLYAHVMNVYACCMPLTSGTRLNGYVGDFYSKQSLAALCSLQKIVLLYMKKDYFYSNYNVEQIAGLVAQLTDLFVNYRPEQAH